MTPIQGHRTKSEIARQFIQARIISGEISAGSPITTREVSLALDMSETPVREAIKGLAAEGWLQHKAHQGTIIAPLNNRQIREIFQLRGLLNAHAMRMARGAISSERIARIGENIKLSEGAVAQNDFAAYSDLNTEFHELLCNFPESEWTYRLFSILRGQSAILRHGFRAIPDGLRHSLDSHLAIYKALSAGNIERAAELVNDDEVSAGDRLIASLNDESAGRKP